MEEHKISFEQIKERAVQKNMDGADKWLNIKDISPLSMFTIISGIKNKNKK
jgi:division protein CdvB (Snf7/Vps24/ESCRT-III family)